MNRRALWTEKKIDEAKQTVREEIDASEYSKNAESRLAFILDKVTSLTNNDSSESRLYRLIYIISALVHSANNGGLSDIDVDRLVKLAYAVLQAEGIKPGTSLLSFLFGDLHLARSQIYRLRGDPWRSAWEQQISMHLSRPIPAAVESVQQLAAGNRSLRLGNALAAIRNFEEAERLGLAGKNLDLAHIGLIRALRLSGRIDEARARIEEFAHATSLRAPVRKELDWEKIAIQSMNDERYDRMADVTREGRSHYEPTYLIEAYLWFAANKTTSWMDSFRKLKSLARVKELNLKDLGLLYKLAQLIEDSYNSDIPISTRLRDLGDQLARVHEINNIDKEMLIWIAAARWLSRVKAWSLAALVLNEYEALSLRLTEGRNHDVFGIVSDLHEKEWYKASVPITKTTDPSP